MGAVGALAPMSFESEGPSIHDFWYFLCQFHQFSEQREINFLAKSKVKHPQFKISTKVVLH